MSKSFHRLLTYSTLLMGLNFFGCKSPENITPKPQITTPAALPDTTQRLPTPKPEPKLDSFFTSKMCDSLVAVAFEFYKTPQTEAPVGKTMAFNAQAADNYPDIFNDFPEARLPLKDTPVINLIKLATLIDVKKTPKLQFIDPTDSLKKVVLESQTLRAIVQDYQKKQITPDEKALAFILFQSKGYNAFVQKTSRIEGADKWGLTAGVFMPTDLLKDFNLSHIYQITSHELGHATHLNTAFNADGTLKPTPSTLTIETEADSTGFVKEESQKRPATGGVYATLNAIVDSKDYVETKGKKINTFKEVALLNTLKATHNHPLMRCLYALCYKLVPVDKFNKNTDEILNPKGGRLASGGAIHCLTFGNDALK